MRVLRTFGCWLVVSSLLACSSPGPVPGDRVVARWKDAFFEATVLEVRGKLVTVGWDQGPPERSGVPRDWVVPVKSAPPDAGPGEVVLCRLGTSWTLGRVERTSSEHWEVRVNGQVQALSSGAVRRVPPSLVDWADAQLRAIEDRAEVARALAATIPAGAGDKVEPSMEVLVRWTDRRWYRAKVLEVGEQQVSVLWADGSGPEEVAPPEVAPLGSRAAPAVGEPALCHWPAGGASGHYWPAMVRARAAAGLRVEWQDGTTGQVGPSDCVGVRQE